MASTEPLLPGDTGTAPSLEVTCQEYFETCVRGIEAAPEFKMPIAVSLAIFAGFSFVYCEVRIQQSSRDSVGQAMAWALFLLDMVLAAVMAITVKAVLSFWAAIPKVKQEVAGLRSYVLKMLDRATNYKDIMFFNLNALEARILAKAFQVEDEAKVEVFQKKQAAERRLDGGLAKVEEAITGFMKSMEAKVNEDLDKVQAGAHEATKAAVAKAREAEDVVLKHVTDVVDEVEGTIDSTLNKVIDGLNSFVGEIDGELDRIVSKVPCACRSKARNSANEVKGTLGKNADKFESGAKYDEEAAFNSVSQAIDSARKKADAEIDQTSKLADQEIDSTMNRVKWNVQQEEQAINNTVQQDEDTVNSMVKLTEAKADAAVQNAADLADQKLKQVDELVKNRTARLEVSVNKKWAQLKTRVEEQMDTTVRNTDHAMDDIREMVRKGAMPIIACQFAIVFWTAANAYLAFTR